MRRVDRDHPHLAFRAERPRRAEYVHCRSVIGFGHVIGVAHDDVSLSVYVRFQAGFGLQSRRGERSPDSCGSHFELETRTRTLISNLDLGGHEAPRK